MVYQYIIGVIIVILLFLIYLFFKARYKTPLKVEEEEFNISINIKNPEESLRNLDTLARRFFKKEIEGEKTYEELEKEFRKKNETKEAKFCYKINYLLYSGEALKKQDILEIINLFEEIVMEKSESDYLKDKSSK